MYFPTAQIETAPWLPPLVAFSISFFTSMGGVSGAFLLLPFQMSFLGYTSPSVSATNQLFNIVAIPSGVYRYYKEKRMLWPLTWIVILGTLPGVLIGAIIRVRYLPDPTKFKLFASAVLFYIGFRLVKDLLTKDRKKQAGERARKNQEAEKQAISPGKDSEMKDQHTAPNVEVTHFSLNRLEYDFQGQSFSVSCLGIFILSLVVGVIGGVYGIGGGSIIAPFFVTVFALPVHTVAGAALMGTFVTSVAGVFFYQMVAAYYPTMSVAPDWLLGFLFGIGGTAGMYMGARCQKHVPAKAIKWLLAAIIISTALKYLLAFFR